MIRKAEERDIPAVAAIYAEIHEAEASGILSTGWLKGIYPIRETAEAAWQRGDLFVLEEQGEVRGAAIINQIPVDVYQGAAWKHRAEEDEVCILHTLVISPRFSGQGYGKAFVQFYERYAAEHGWAELRMDTNARNRSARAMYHKLGYEEVAIVPTVFNGIPNVDLVLLEKHLMDI